MEEIKLEDVKRVDRERKTVFITLRTTKTICEWMTKNKVSPTKVFDKAVEILMKIK